VPIDTFVAERFLYAPLAGIGLAAAGLWDYLGSSPRETRQFRLGARWLLGLWVAVLAVLTVAYVGAWRNDLALWKSAVHQEPRNAFARACLAEALSAAGQLEAAREEYQTALRNGPSMAVAVSCLTNLAEIENRLGRPEQALAWSRKALQAQPRAAPALYNEIVALALLSRRSEALSVLERAEATHPDSPAWARLRAQVLATPVKRFRP
jgi:tetratricopeptide (TPR) repeat protein